MFDLKKSIIFDIEQRYFLLKKINIKLAKRLFISDSRALFYFNQNFIISKIRQEYINRFNVTFV